MPRKHPERQEPSLQGHVPGDLFLLLLTSFLSVLFHLLLLQALLNLLPPWQHDTAEARSRRVRVPDIEPLVAK